ncbi:unnamed protein product [Phytomonas sp. Hart1]|nr:unnamed protein product [Phytomonas sp. Hart1]|eukprot:CCW68038.1 unnamed protein product [Phytomonas sp. isolate Hart1]
MKLESASIGGEPSWASALLSSSIDNGAFSINTFFQQNGSVLDGVILRSLNTVSSLKDTDQQLRTLQMQSWAQAECERQFRFLNMPFELKMIHISFDDKICVVYYQINPKADTSSEPNISRLLRVLQYHLSCKVHLVRWPIKVEQKGNH